MPKIKLSGTVSFGAGDIDTTQLLVGNYKLVVETRFGGKTFREVVFFSVVSGVRTVSVSETHPLLVIVIAIIVLFLLNREK